MRLLLVVFLFLLVAAASAEAVCTWPNEPAGATLVGPNSDVQFTWTPVFGVTTNNWNFNGGSQSGLSLVNNPLGISAPCDGSGAAWDYFYPVGLAQGTSPATVEFDFANFPTGYTSGVIYLSYWLMYSVGFVNQPLNKGLQLCQLGGANNLDPCIFYEHRGVGDTQTSAPTFPWVDIESTNQSNNAVGPNPNVVQFAQGSWHQAELTMDLATFHLRVWGDGLLVYDQIMLPFMTHSINGLLTFVAWGGNCVPDCPLQHAQHLYLSHVRISISTGTPPPPPPAPANPCCLTVTKLLHNWFLQWLPWLAKAGVTIA